MTNCHQNHSIIEKVLNKKQISIPNHTAIQTEAHLYLSTSTVEIRELRNSTVLFICHLLPHTQAHPFSLWPYLNKTPITQQMWRSLTFITLW